MLTLPAPVLNYLFTTTIANRSPAYLFISKDGHLQDWGGKLSTYGVTNLQRGEAINSQVFFLEGLLPLNETELFLPRMKTNDGLCADVYLFPGSEGDWILLLDATLDELQHSLLQQYRNDLSLLQNRHAQLFSQQLGDPVTDLSPALLTLLPDGERKDVTILFAELRDFIPYSEQNPPGAVFRALNLYLRSMIQAVVSEAGTVDKLIGDVVMACFGVLPATGSTATHAIQAALRILESVQDINRLRQAEHQPVFEVGIGIASGLISFGILGSRNHKTLGAIGHYVNLAATLQRRANPSEILVDANTFNQAKEMQFYFSATDRSVSGLIEPIQIYSLSKE
ncbi:MAG: adenylate/guanylate cyclase domain-containing protein [Cyanobacteria bacterium CRU_2_1]|nr:adenylate/guanylate cyclase domain-containing protein [Cyanobacteria bacterium RU_5_0]NJR58504.1 adenylate/guanylate cyclase domain-containing protein [Cyanobacteria bacterium CRU_2_1]